MNIELVLQDGTVLSLEDASYGKHFVILCEDRQAFQDAWDTLTDDNLSEVIIMISGAVVQTITGLTLKGAQAVINPDDTITGHFYLDGGIYVSPSDDYSEAGRILLGEEE